MNRRHLIALAVAFGVPTAVGSAYIIKQEEGHRRRSLAERRLPEPFAELRLALADPLPQTPDQALPTPEGLDGLRPLELPAPTAPLPPSPDDAPRPLDANPETGLDLPAPTAPLPPPPDDAPQPPDARPAAELSPPLPTPRPAPEPRQPIPAQAPADAFAPEPATATPSRRSVSTANGRVSLDSPRPSASRPSPLRRSPMRADSDSGLTPSPFQAPASSSLPSAAASVPSSPAPESAAVDERTLAEQAQRIAREFAEQEMEPYEGWINSQRQLLTQTLERQFDLRQRRYNDEVAALEARVQSLKALIEKRQMKRDEIVGNRMDQLFREAEDLGW